MDPFLQSLAGQMGNVGTQAADEEAKRKEFLAKNAAQINPQGVPFGSQAMGAAGGVAAGIPVSPFQMSLQAGDAPPISASYSPGRGLVGMSGAGMNVTPTSPAGWSQGQTNDLSSFLQSQRPSPQSSLMPFNENDVQATMKMLNPLQGQLRADAMLPHESRNAALQFLNEQAGQNQRYESLTLPAKLNYMLGAQQLQHARDVDLKSEEATWEKGLQQKAMEMIFGGTDPITVMSKIAEARKIMPALSSAAKGKTAAAAAPESAEAGVKPPRPGETFRYEDPRVQAIRNKTAGPLPGREPMTAEQAAAVLGPDVVKMGEGQNVGSFLTSLYERQQQDPTFLSDPKRMAALQQFVNQNPRFAPSDVQAFLNPNGIMRFGNALTSMFTHPSYVPENFMAGLRVGGEKLGTAPYADAVSNAILGKTFGQGPYEKPPPQAAREYFRPYFSTR